MMVMVVAMRVESKGGEEEERGRKGMNSGKGLGLRGCWWRGRKEKDEQLQTRKACRENIILN